MGEKERLSVRVDPSIKSELDEQANLNTSGLVRDLLDAYLILGDSIEVGLERRLKDAEQELQTLERKKTEITNKIEAKRREVDRIETKIEERRNQTPEAVIEFAERIRSDAFDRGHLEPDNPAVKNWASKAGIGPADFVEAVERRLEP